MIRTTRQSIINNNASLPKRGLLAIPFFGAIGIGSLFLVAFANLVSIYDYDSDTTTTLDIQSLAKLLFVAGLAVYSFQRSWVDPRVFRLMFSMPGALLTAVGFLLVASCMVSNSPAVSLASAIITSTCIWGAMAASLHLGVESVLKTVYMAAVVFLAAGVIYYFINPAAAILQEPLENAQFEPRFAGLSHPNTIGQYSGLVVLLTLVWFWPKQSGMLRRLLSVAILVMAVATLIFSESRTSIGALVLSLIFVSRDRLFTGKWLLTILVIATAGLGFLSVAASYADFGSSMRDRLIQSISKSNNIEELTTATGRVEIWGATAKLIAERPLTGYGAATSKELLHKYALYTHNLFLNVVLSGGLIAGGLVVAMFSVGFWNALSRPIRAVDGLIAFIFLNGLGENVVFLVVDSAPMLLLALALIWRRAEELIAATGRHRAAVSYAISVPAGLEGAKQ